MFRALTFSVITFLSVVPLSAQYNIVRSQSSNRLTSQGLPKVISHATTNRISDKELQDTILKHNKSFAEVLKAREVETEFQFAKSILDQTLIIGTKEHYTMIAPGSILYFPDFLKKEVTIGTVSDGSQFLGWQEFYQKYQGLFSPVEVSLAQTVNKSGFSNEQVSLGKSLQKILVSVYRTNPVTCKAKYEAAQPTQ